MFTDNYLPAVQNGETGLEHSHYAGGLTGLVSDPNFAGLRRPYLDAYDRPTVTINRGRTTLVRGQQVPVREPTLVRDVVWNHGVMLPVFNATSLRKEEWLELDRQVLRAARYRMRAWADLAAQNSFGGFNAMGKMVLEHETMSDPGSAQVDMDALTEGRTDAPKFQLEGLPLPITHSDFWFSARRLAISRNSGTPLDTTMGEAAGRRVAETVEKMTIGIYTGPIYGGNSTQVGGYGRTSQVYGYINFPSRLTKTNMTVPTGTNAGTTLTEVLTALDQLKANKFYGPFMIYTSNDWDKFMDNDYILTGGNVATQTLRERLKKIENVMDVRRLDFLFASAPSASLGPGYEYDATLKTYRLVFVQMTPDVARAVNGMDITTVQWESVGGMRLNFKVMCIQVPQLRADFYGNCGVLDATNS